MDLMPEELNKKNKRFHVVDLKGGAHFDRVEENFVWLEEAGIALSVRSATDPRIPLRLSRDSAFFKLFMNDVGLLSAMYSGGIQLRLLSGETEINYGSVYENFVAQELHAHGFPLYYFSSRKVGEVDFLIEDGGRVEPLEVKSGRHYKSHAALDNLIDNAESEHLTRFAAEPLLPNEEDWRRETFNMALRRVFADPSIGETSKIAFRRFVQLGEDAAKVAADLGITANNLYQIRSRLKQRIAEEVQTATSSALLHHRRQRRSRTK